LWWLWVQSEREQALVQQDGAAAQQQLPQLPLSSHHRTSATASATASTTASAIIAMAQCSLSSMLHIVHPFLHSKPAVARGHSGLERTRGD
jgi:hypothetical protein